MKQAGAELGQAQLKLELDMDFTKFRIFWQPCFLPTTTFRQLLPSLLTILTLSPMIAGTLKFLFSLA